MSAPAPLPGIPPAPRRLTRRRFLALGALGATAAPAGAAAWAAGWEPRWLEVTHQRPLLPGVTPGPVLRVVHLADLHASRWTPLAFLAEAVRLAVAQRPDLILLTGDYVTGRFADLDGLAATLAPLATAAPTLASLGNHDGGPRARPAGGYPTTTPVRRTLEAAGLRVLVNARETLTLRGRPVTVTGLGDLLAEDFAPHPVLPVQPAGAPPPDHPAIVLTHHPDTIAELAPHAWNLALCGHTHGGQVRLPLLGAPVLCVRDTRFATGLNHLGSRPVHTTRGVGSHFGLRLLCRPEVAVLDLP